MFTLLNTRPAHQAEGLSRQARCIGYDVLTCPLLEIACIKTTASALPNPAAPALWLFTSANSVRCWPWPTAPHGPVIAIGSATRQALRQRWPRLSIADLPARADSEHLLAHPLLQTDRTLPVHIVKGTGGRTLLETTLRQQGRTVHVLPCYQRQVAPFCRPAWRRFRHAACPVLLAMSVETVEVLMHHLSLMERRWLTTQPVATLSPRIAQTLQQRWHWSARHVHVAATADISGMIECLERIFRKAPCPRRKHPVKSLLTTRRTCASANRLLHLKNAAVEKRC